MADQMSLRTKKSKGTVKSSCVSGSMTLEATMALPIFLFFFLNLLSLFQMLYIQASVTQALHTTGKQLATYAYACRAGVEGFAEDGSAAGAGTLGVLGGIAFSETAAKALFYNNLGDPPLLSSGIRGGKYGISFLRSYVLPDEHDEIKLIAEYTAVPFMTVMGFGGIPMNAVYFGHAWTGYTPGSFTLTGMAEEIVYITEHGTVYHRDINCTYLNPSMRTVSASALAGERNRSGGIYKACELCGGTATSYIITSYGDRYHTSASCSGLKRSISAVPISEAGGRAPCSKCGY